MQIEQLQAETIHQLRARMAATGAGWNRKETKAELIERLVLISSNMQTEQLPPPSVAAPKSSANRLSKGDMEAALAKHIQRGLWFKCDDETWHIKFRDREESGNTAIPLAVLVRCANLLMQAVSFRE